MSPFPATAVLIATALVLGGLLPFAGHRTWLLWASRRGRRPRFLRWEGPLPAVTVQLPVFNERNVVERLIDAACRLDYPRDRLEIQVLDDSTDDTTGRARRCIDAWRARGVDVRHVRRGRRTGFKAGALAQGTRSATGDFLLILDADFVPDQDLIHQLLGPFRDPSVGMVQARWDHLNEDRNGLTRAQALLLDGHFFFEQGGRYAAQAFFNFNGTAGMWRRTCLEDAGGWRADTLTEDLDLSYRAQMAGWTFEYLEGVGVPAELPETVQALEVQQRRWAQGGIQTARKLLPALLRGPWSGHVKREAAVHLLGHLAHPLTVALGLLLFPSAVARRALGLDAWMLLDLVVFGMATIPFVAFYTATSRSRGRSWPASVLAVPRALALGIGLSAPVSLAVVRGLRGARDPFLRTPKRGRAGKRDLYQLPPHVASTALKAGLGLWAWGSMVWAGALGMWASLPFLALFAIGYTWMLLPRTGATLPVAQQVEHQQAAEGHPDRQSHRQGLGPRPRVLEHV